ncbi:MAG: hypothetical protein RBU26_14170 [Sphaerochaeta sp.]|jgi:hypothetical protein|uniref:hypothetical protein n=1 Tax=Sphaerochaeta sp. TaxID=1972642 RepID=UPI002A360B0C|nr:hypothetical protein [Sphaerochaeta sp.]MDX9826067.1 hypothetical protein [Sphaerochaeta sp.]
MCWKWLTGSGSSNPGPEISDDEFLSATHKALLYGINDYPGKQNDLRGCVNDITDREARLKQFWPQFKIRKYLDDQATIANFRTEAVKAIASVPPGGVVVVPFDSCFSGTATRAGNKSTLYRKSRFMDPGLPPRKLVRRIARTGGLTDMKWLAYSACLESQTAADALIGGRYNGAFTYYDVAEMVPGITYAEHYRRIRRHLPSPIYTQVPGLEGPEELQNEILYERPTLIIAFSGHGSYQYAADITTEADGMDETIVLHDGHLPDNIINSILMKIAV